MQRPAAEVLVQDPAELGHQRRVLQRDRDAVGQPDPHDPDDLAVGGEPEVEGLAPARVVHAGATAAGWSACIPRRFISSVKDRNTPGCRWTGRWATKVPCPRRRSTSPSLVSSWRAWRTVIRLTENRSHSSASLGSGIARTGPLDQGAQIGSIARWRVCPVLWVFVDGAMAPRYGLDHV